MKEENIKKLLENLKSGVYSNPTSNIQVTIMSGKGDWEISLTDRVTEYCLRIAKGSGCDDTYASVYIKTNDESEDGNNNISDYDDDTLEISPELMKELDEFIFKYVEETENERLNKCIDIFSL